MDGWMERVLYTVGRRSGKQKGGEGSIGPRSVFWEVMDGGLGWF